MPQCIECERNWTPSSANADGTCPTCGGALRAPLTAHMDAEADAGRPRTPWHFKVLVLAAALYLGWRAVQGVDWVIHHL
jgi:hypothetical protein